MRPDSNAPPGSPRPSHAPATVPHPHPITFEPVLLQKVWGGRSLERIGKHLPTTDGSFGESWELADMDSTSASGAGGGAIRSVIASGPLHGRSIRDALSIWGEAMLPKPLRTPAGGFPLLIKFLDARENLSVQVHPSPEFARAHPDAHLKTECWCILHAEPDASIYVGVRPDVSPERFRSAARAGDPAIVDMLRKVPAVAGECHNLPSGTVHALGAGVLVAEVQTPSDTTFRLYDWGRSGRELHVEPALASADFLPPPAPVQLLGSDNRVHTRYFELSSRTITAAHAIDSMHGQVLMILRGSGSFCRGHERVPLPLGQSAFIPHACEPGWTIEPAPASPLTALLARPIAPR